jgi:hypothetical protein
MSSILESELERLARVAVSHGLDDPAVDIFLVFVGALDLLPDAATLKPAAQLIGKPRLAEALDRPGETRLGACRLLAAATSAGSPAVVAAPRVESASVTEPRAQVPEPVTVERGSTEHGISELLEALRRAIRSAVGRRTSGDR